MIFSETKNCTAVACKPKNTGLVITIDGPAGAGKTTVSKRIADRLDYRYIDTGALYRGVAFEARQAGIAPEDDVGLETLCSTLALDFKPSPEGLRLFSRGRDISDFIRSPEITMLASAVSARKPVRIYLVEIQRNFGKKKHVVLEGRDMGTVIFPDADVKFFLMASAEIRAKRRFEQMTGRNHQTLAQVENDMRKRDADDSSRSLAPLKPADDAILIDSTGLSLDQVTEIMLMHIKKVLEPFQR